MIKLYSYAGKEPYIFISYAHRDKNLVYPVIAKMQEDGYRAWFDEGIDPGTEWDETIAQSIDRCGYFIAFVSNNYINSNNCKDELKYARDLSKKCVLIYLEDVVLSSGMAMRMNRLQSIFKHNYSDESEFYRKLYLSDGISNFASKPKASQRAQAPKSDNTKTITFSNSTYIGEVNERGEMHGKGTLRFNDGDVYEGEFKNNKFNGRGTLQFSNGDVYIGEFRDNSRTGYGTYVFASGTTYEGEFKDGKFCGKGTWRSADEDVYEGDFVDNKFCGHGILHYASGTVYEGDFQDDKRTGHGTLRYADGNVYEGVFKDDELHGQGTMHFSNGDIYDGDFQNGSRTGYGTYRFASGAFYEGEFYCGNLHGKGTYRSNTGTVYSGTFKDGRFVG